MAYPRPKILTEITVPSGGWDLDFIVSVAGSLDTPVTATVDAGTYFLAWDNQADDLLWALAREMRTAAVAATADTSLRPNLYLNAENHVVFHFRGGFTGVAADVEITWTTSNTDLAAALGFDSSTDDQSIGDDQPIITGDYQHAQGWYADADGQLSSLLTEDISIATTPQAIAYSGQSYAQHLGERFTNELALQWLPRALTYSRGKGYGETPLAPYARNVGLESWWHEAKLGRRFRVYREGRNDDSAAIDRLEKTASIPTSVTDANKSFGIDPQEHLGRLLLVLDRSTRADEQPARFFVSAHSATVVTVPQTSDFSAVVIAGTDTTCLILDQRYETYVVDLESMPSFAPIERPGVDYYDITIPLLRYES